ncbi:NAD(P)/FAD-dependent oxidoreductase [Candidatus Azambacteria bacterium]|nr:NAD(P)/FAD-dependent oxidoreductase [Candidatus Azambacteria bacterium]
MPILASEKQKTETVWDVIVIGGGPAGMMAAGRAGGRPQKPVLKAIKEATI